MLTHGFTLDEQGRKMSKSVGNVIAPQKVTDEYGADILRLWVMNTEFTEDQRIGREILKQQAELYRRLRNTLRWLLGSLDGWSEDERAEFARMPLQEAYILLRLGAIDRRVRQALHDHNWTGVYPEIHAFCSADLSAFYFDIRKDSLYCDRPDEPRRRACRTVLDLVHRCLCTWLAPVLCFTAEDAWTARFGDRTSVHLEHLVQLPELQEVDAFRTFMDLVRERRSDITTVVERLRQQGEIGSSLQAKITVPMSWQGLTKDDWAELAIVSSVSFDESILGPSVDVAPGEKCARCWRVLPEVGSQAAHPTLCLRCTDAVESGLVREAAA